jgi:hypothetical protein
MAFRSYHWQWDRNRDVDSDLADIDVLGELASRGAVGREDGGAVAVLVRVDQLKCQTTIKMNIFSNKNAN